VDEAHVLLEGKPFPLPDSSVDLVVADWTFEHVRDCAHIAAEISRVLRPGGWLCARTPNKWGYVGVAARTVPNRFHTRVLRRLQPTRQDRDVFPTLYRLNTMRALRHYFPAARFEHCTYAFDGEPRYFGSSTFACRAVQTLGHLTPPHSRSVWNVFLRKLPQPRTTEAVLRG
jgi:SAM-dependent methyltransferase